MPKSIKEKNPVVTPFERVTKMTITTEIRTKDKMTLVLMFETFYKIEFDIELKKKKKKKKIDKGKMKIHN